MSSLWTPEGEHPVERDPVSTAFPGDEGDDGEDAGEPTDAEFEALRDQLARTPAAVVVTNHCLGLWELAALHLSLRPPQLEQAALAIDALGAIVERLEGRLGDEEAMLRDGLAQLRLAFVSVKTAATAPGA
jgi:Domain of unknown function (DUF1844)